MSGREELKALSDGELECYVDNARRMLAIEEFVDPVRKYVELLFNIGTELQQRRALTPPEQGNKSEHETPVQSGSMGAPASSAPGDGLGCDRARRQEGAQVPRATAVPIPSRPMPDYATVPARHMIPGISLYLEKGVPPGSFLMALLQNDLAGAVRAADQVNLVLMREWVLWLHDNLPAECHGSPERVEAWCDKLEDT